MDGRQGLENRSGRPRLGRGVLVAYLRTGAALAILRVSLYAWVEHRAVLDRTTKTVYYLAWALNPEGFLAGYTRVGAISFSSLTQYYLFWGSVLTLGSFIMATPILLVGWLMQRRW